MPILEVRFWRPTSTETVNGVVAACKRGGLTTGKNFDTVPGMNNVLTTCPPPNTRGEDLTFPVREEVVRGR